MSYIICLHTTYNSIEVALALDDGTLLKIKEIPKEKASSSLIKSLDQLLHLNHLRMSDVAFIVANRGPAPFTTLRTLIATADGLAFASKIPLVGVTMFQAFAYQCSQSDDVTKIFLLNAYNQAVYFALYESPMVLREMGCQNIKVFIKYIHEKFSNNKLRFYGNGAQMYWRELASTFGNDMIMHDPLPLVPSIEAVVKCGVQLAGDSRNKMTFIEPLYLRKPVVTLQQS